ncbi:hypothetical protein [Phascolarctobacterium succinatutens]|uniref:AbiJ-related protein n=1 Tax=Phascolarctobacterium succinatutens TaxID=626940 RepID=UPI00265FD1A7|nr:hypothetical protein [Phascolarctobacterium succinatutens]
MKQITEITRRDIFSLFIYGMDIEEFFDSKRIKYGYYGRLSEIDFLKRIYDLKSLQSFDNRFDDAEGDIWQHTINNDDYEEGWIFEDARFELLNGDDEVLLKFLCTVFHPAVRNENGYWKEFLEAVNGLLRADGYELYSESKISGRDVFGWRKYDPEESSLFVPFSQRNEKDIKGKKLKLSLNMKTRSQIYKLIEKYSTVYRETDETGWQYDITTSECVFRDMSQFYRPKCFDAKNNYIETTSMEEFILHNYPFYVFDAIELYEKYNTDSDYAAQMNMIFKLNSVPYKLEQGRIVSTLEIAIDPKILAEIPEKGLKELLSEANAYYRSGNKQIAVEKIWDAFERLKTYYSPTLNKAQSADKIIDNMSNSEPNYKTLYEAEFKALTNIGNNFRIRHHETTKIDITDNRQYDYFYKRCLALVSVAILYLEGGINA